MDPEASFFRRHKIVTALLVLVLLVIGFFGYRMWGPHRSYRVDFVKTGDGSPPGMLQVGVAKRDITPDLSQYDTYNDVNGNGKYEPKFGPFLSRIFKKFEKNYDPNKADTYNDVNKNGKFDPVWIAGFGMNRPAKGVHDPLWVRAIAFRNNGVTLVMVTTDSIGIFHDKYITIRKSIDPSLKIDHVVFSSMHNHETPDTMGNWSGPPPTPWSFDYKNMARIQRLCKEAIEEAVKSLQPAEMQCIQIELPPEGFSDDSRKPIVLDRKLSCMRLVKPGTDETIATVVNWGCHPETLGGDNPLLTSDFSGYWRDGVESGVPDPNGVKGLGGMCLYFQGMVGGLMTQLHTTVPHRDGVQKLREEGFEKAEALGQNLAIATVKALRSNQMWKNENPRVTIAAKTVYAPMSTMFRYAILLGLLHPGVYWTSGGVGARSEVDALRIGNVEIITVPGELYPEIADGGVEAKDGRDFSIEPVEVPPLRAGLMKGRMNMVLGLANDEIGYIIPKSQWDTQPPFVYNNRDQYGEENSGGYDVAPMVHHELAALLQRLHDALPK